MSDVTVSTYGGRQPGAASGGGALFVPAMADGLVALVLAALLTATPILVHLLHPAMGILCGLLLFGLCAWFMPPVAVTAVFFALVFQNLFVSLIIDAIHTKEELDVIRGYNFLMLATCWVAAWARYLAAWEARERALDPFVRLSVVIFAVFGVYFLLGFALYGMTAIIYLRNVVTPMLLFHICMLTFQRFPVRPGVALTVIAGLVALCGLIEFFERQVWLDWTNGLHYWEQSSRPNFETLAFDKAYRETGRVPTGMLDGFRIDLFNSPLLADLGIEVMRLFGPNMHAISYAYALCFFCVFALYRGRWIMGGALFVLLVLANAKGPILIFLIVGASFATMRLFGTRMALAANMLMLAGYAVLGVLVGLSIGDYHVLGLMGGIHAFFGNPVGLGIGAGGNLSSEFANLDWPTAQALGRTPFAVESAVGVLLYQIGVFAFLLIGAYVWIASRVLVIARTTGNALHAAAAFALLSVAVTGLFQEEAYFAPLALGMFMGLAGMIVGAAARTGLLARLAGQKIFS